MGGRGETVLLGAAYVGRPGQTLPREPTGRGTRWQVGQDELDRMLRRLSRHEVPENALAKSMSSTGGNHSPNYPCLIVLRKRLNAACPNYTGVAGITVLARGDLSQA